MKHASTLFFTCIVGLGGCSTTSVITSSEDLKIDAVVAQKNCSTAKEKQYETSITTFAVDTLAGYILDFAEEKFENYAKKHIKQYKVEIDPLDKLYRIANGDPNWKSLCVDTKLKLRFAKKESGNTEVLFELPLAIQSKKGEPSIEIKLDDSENISSSAALFQKESFPGTATLNMSWKTLWRENNKGMEKVVWDGKLVSFKFDKSGKVEYKHKTKNNDNKEKSVTKVIPLPPYSLINGTPAQSRHILSFTLTVINTDSSDIIERLAESFKNEKSDMQEAIVEAYKDSLKDND